MYIAVVPNRSSPPAVLLRESYRENGKVKTRTLANLSSWPAAQLEALRRVLRGDSSAAVAGTEPVCDRSVGVLVALKTMADQIGLTRVLGTDRMATLALFLVFSRVAHQGSRLSAMRWARDQAVYEVLGLSGFDENHLYQALDWLAKQHQTLEKRLYRRYIHTRGAVPALVLYDVTSSYLEGQCNEWAAFGYNRDGKRGKRQIVIGLLTAADGEPLAIRVFRGNTGDPTTVADQVQLLRKQFHVQEVVFVGDRGMVKTKGKVALHDAGFRYITALTDPQVRTLLSRGQIQLGLFDTVVHEVESEGRRWILRRNDAVRDKERRRRQDKLQCLRALIDRRNQQVACSARAKPEAGLRHITRWLKRHRIDAFVTLTLHDRQLAMVVDETAQAEHGLLDGCYVLETDVPRDTLDPVTIDQRYRSLQQVERNFRTMKTGLLEVRPLFVRRAGRTQGHLVVAMLALKMVRHLEQRLQQAFGSTEHHPEAMTVPEALQALSRLCLLRYRVADRVLLRWPRPDARQRAVLQALQISWPTGEMAEAA